MQAALNINSSLKPKPTKLPPAKTVKPSGLDRHTLTLTQILTPALTLAPFPTLTLTLALSLSLTLTLETSDAEEKAPLSKRARPDPAPSKSPAPASSRKRKADELEAVKEIVDAIDAMCKPNPSSDPIRAWELLQALLERGQFKDSSVVHEKSSQSQLGSLLKRWTIEAIDIIAARGGDSSTVRHYETASRQLMIRGLSY